MSESVKTAKWERVNRNEPWIANGEPSGAAISLPPDYVYECSWCGYGSFRELPSIEKCPECGRKMRNGALKKCRWEHDEVCVNASCPKCSDFCPVLDEPGVCRYEDRGKKTNADKIRSMTDEELADLFIEKHDDENYFACPVRFFCGCSESDCMVCFLDWLKQEAEE